MIFPSKNDTAIIEVFHYSEIDVPFVSGIIGPICLDTFKQIEKIIGEDRKELLTEGFGSYIFMADWISPQIGDYGRLELNGYWELTLIEYKPLSESSSLESPLTEIQKKVIIATYFGWKGFAYSPFLTGFPPWDKTSCGQSEIIPDYFNDLNEMRKVENRLTSEQKPTYFDNLVKLTGKTHMSLRHQQYFDVVTATAAQRADAFIMTIKP